jgi:hypothetical protein
MSEQPTVADYIVGRLAREGITDCFGVAGELRIQALRRGSAERGSPPDRMFRRARRGVHGRRLRSRAGLFDALDHLCRRRVVRAQRRDGSQPAALGCRGWFTAKVSTLGELDAALARAATGESASYIEVVGGRMDFPAGPAMAHQRLDAMYGNG